MKMQPGRRSGVLSLLTIAAALGGAGSALLGTCGPFTDVAADAFCPFVLEVFTLGVTTGTSPTTYDPTTSVSRLQMAAFLSRTADAVLKRAGRRAALKRFWTTQNAASLGQTTLGAVSFGTIDSDGTDLWVPVTGGLVQRVHGGTGRVLETWTGASVAGGVLTAMGRIIVTGRFTPGLLYQIDPSQPPGAVTTVASTLGPTPSTIAFDGGRIWTANVADFSAGSGSISIVTPGATIPWTVTTVSLNFNLPVGPLYDGSNMWVTDGLGNTLLKLDAAAAVLQTVTVGTTPILPVFDGANIWVPNNGSSSVTVVRASSGAVLATLTGNGLTSPYQAAFDGQRILVTNNNGTNVSLWKAADLTVIGSFTVGTGPTGVCSDGISFWMTLTGGLGRF